jgi:hypothetical protein
MMKRFDMRAAICVAAMIWGAVAHAADTAVFGVGQQSCGRLIASVGGAPPGAYKTMNTASGILVSENAQYQEWLMGFVSGFNSTHAGLAQQVTNFDLAGMDLWMRNWCNKHPTQTVFEGAYTFIDEMRSNAAARR